MSPSPKEVGLPPERMGYAGLFSSLELLRKLRELEEVAGKAMRRVGFTGAECEMELAGFIVDRSGGETFVHPLMSSSEALYAFGGKGFDNLYGVGKKKDKAGVWFLTVDWGSFVKTYKVGAGPALMHRELCVWNSRSDVRMGSGAFLVSEGLKGRAVEEKIYFSDLICARFWAGLQKAAGMIE